MKNVGKKLVYLKRNPYLCSKLCYRKMGKKICIISRTSEPSVLRILSFLMLLTLCPIICSASEKDATVLRGTFNEGGSEGWSEGDSICIYTLESMHHNSYLLSAGAGTPYATFLRVSGTDNYGNSNKLYALTSCKYLYGLSATWEGEAKVAVEIPSRLTTEEVISTEGSSRMPLPYWGEARFGEDGVLEASFRGMTSLLKVDIGLLPARTRAIVLTTHSYTDLVGGESPEGGDSKPLSGMFDTALTDGAKLTPNPIFYSYDTLRVNIAPDAVMAKHSHLYIPVISESYANLHVIAVTGDSRYAYEWEGKVLKTYNPDTPFLTNTIVSLEVDEPPYTAGDANGDGTVNAADIVEVVNYIMGSPSSTFVLVAADVNGDGSVNAADIVLIVNLIMSAQ